MSDRQTQQQRILARLLLGALVFGLFMWWRAAGQ